MPTLDRIILTIDSSIGTGEFHMMGNTELSLSQRTGYLVGGRGSTVNAVVSNTTGDGNNNREGFFIDLGGGAFTAEVEWRNWQSATDYDGNPLQWGDTGDPSTVTKTDATGANALQQMECLFYWLNQSEIDSRGNRATLEYGEHHSDGLYDPLQVVPEQPTMSRAADDGSWCDGSITFIRAGDITEKIDAMFHGGQ